MVHLAPGSAKLYPLSHDKPLRNHPLKNCPWSSSLQRTGQLLDSQSTVSTRPSGINAFPVARHSPFHRYLVNGYR